MCKTTDFIETESLQWNKKALKDIRFFMSYPEIMDEWEEPYLDKLVRQIEHINMFRENFDQKNY
ncbi:MAG: hypothetical protein HOK41_05105 [Nitrospina sp.]|jgi:hypothetical protein|nr:hypothetical protein [Nitrospina sp.]